MTCVLYTLLLCAAASHLWLEGTFIQYSRRLLADESPTRLTQAIDSAHDAGLHIIIVQRLAAGEQSFIPGPDAPFDPTETILAYADTHDMQVFLGLAEDARWWKQPFDADFLAKLGDRSIEVARQASERYGTHTSFAGWYIPLETWDVCPPDSIGAVAGLFRQVAEACRALRSGKPVAFAPFFTGMVRPEDVAGLYARFLPLARLDILMLQDGVGARGWDDKVRIVEPYFTAMAATCREAGVEMWGDVELFTKDFKPGAPKRILEQLRVESPHVKKLVAFEFFHYMDPARGEQQRALFDYYQAQRRPAREN